MITEDFDAYLDTWGESVTWHSASGVTTVTGIFSQQYVGEEDGGFEYRASVSSMGFRYADVLGIRAKDVIIRGSVQYVVLGVEPDGLGWVEVPMERKI